MSLNDKKIEKKKKENSKKKILKKIFEKVHQKFSGFFVIFSESFFMGETFYGEIIIFFF